MKSLVALNSAGERRTEINMKAFLLLVLLSLSWMKTSESTQISKLTCEPAMYRCWMDFSVADLPNANVRITVTYAHMSGEETLFFVKISNLAEVTPYENFDYREDFELYYDIADHSIYEFERLDNDIHTMSEVLTPLRFDRGDYEIKSNKNRIVYITTCPYFLFQGIKVGVRMCMEVNITKDSVTMMESKERPILVKTEMVNGVVSITAFNKADERVIDDKHKKFFSNLFE